MGSVVVYIINDVTSTYASGATAVNNSNDVVGIALDLDNNKAYYHVNGTYWNSANPSNGTGGLSINAASSTETGFYFPSISDLSSNRSYVYALTLVMVTSEQQQYLQKELMHQVLVNLSMMYQLVTQLYQLKD